MGKARNKRRAGINLNKPSQLEVNQCLRVVHWNANGIMQDTKIELLAEVMISEQIDLCFIDETLLQHGNNDNLSCLKNFTTYTKERSFGSKKGGGKMTIIRPDLNHTRWDPGLVMFPNLEAERSWILVHENGKQIAFCSVYCAAEVHNEQFKIWNNELYMMIRYEMETIKSEGFDCIILGDLNGHVGNDDRGIEGNSPDINYNGKLLRDFIDSNDLIMINADKTRCSGLFTRTNSNSATCIDYVLADSNSEELIMQMTIDSNKEVLWGSDHSSVLIELNMGIILDQGYITPEPKVPNPSKKSAPSYASTLDRLLSELSDPGMDLENRCKLFQESAIKAAQLTGHNVHLNKARSFATCKSVRKLRTRCIKLESSITRRFVWAKANNLDPNSHFPNWQSDKNEAEELRIRFRDKVRQKKGR